MKLFRIKNYDYGVNIQFPITTWWGIMALLTSTAMILKFVACKDFVYCGDIDKLSMWSNIFFIIFFTKGWISIWKTHRVLDDDKRIF